MIEAFTANIFGQKLNQNSLRHDLLYMYVYAHIHIHVESCFHLGKIM